MSFFLYLLLVVCYGSYALAGGDYIVDDIFIPTECESVAGAGDHLLIEYSVHFSNGTEGAYLRKPSQLYHILLDTKVSYALLSFKYLFLLWSLKYFLSSCFCL
jgi:hypothetical protein